MCCTDSVLRPVCSADTDGQCCIQCSIQSYVHMYSAYGRNGGGADAAVHCTVLWPIYSADTDVQCTRSLCGTDVHCTVPRLMSLSTPSRMAADSADSADCSAEYRAPALQTAGQQAHGFLAGAWKPRSDRSSRGQRKGSCAVQT